MIIDKNFVYVHIPKTGGTWMRQALRLLPSFEHEYAGHRISIPVEHLHKPVFTIVRNPWDLYVSSYTHFHYNFTKKIHEFGTKNKLTESKKFLIERFGGSFADMLQHIDFYKDYMSRNYESLHDKYNVLKYENGLASELIKFLDEHQVALSQPIRIRIEQLQNSRFNSHQQHRKGSYYTKELEKLVAHNDCSVIALWGYSCPPELKAPPSD